MHAFRSVSRRASLAGLICLWSSVAFAAPQTPSPVTADAPPRELLLGVTLQTPTDVNLPPLCGQLALPCTSPKTVPDAGVSVIYARNISEHFAIVGEAGIYDNVWDSAATVHANHREGNQVLSAVIGPRLSTGFLTFGGPRPSTLRAFGQVGVGVEVSGMVPGGKAVRPGAGVDLKTMHFVLLRLELDYSFVPSTMRSIGGGRVLLAVGFGLGGDL